MHLSNVIAKTLPVGVLHRLAFILAKLTLKGFLVDVVRALVSGTERAVGKKIKDPIVPTAD